MNTHVHPIMVEALRGFAPPQSAVHQQTHCSQCGQPQGPGASGFSACSEHEMARYKLALASMDWQYQFSDDFSVYKTGERALAGLHEMQRRLDPTGEIWAAARGARAHGAPSAQVVA